MRKRNSGSASSREEKYTIDMSEVQFIINLLKDTDVSHLKLTRGDQTLEITRGVYSKTVFQSSTEYPENVQPRPLKVYDFRDKIEADQSRGEQVSKQDDSIVEVKSPMVGIFYRRPSPDEDPFVEIGTIVNEGDTLAIIEAMKVMNQVKSPVSGIIEEITAENGNMVEYGEVLFKIRKT
ncbi:MAG: acetyl-CoA carboxylase biotin carboxyl carrier protein [Deltaproteobacteria bacterium]|nr:acetyl-CoA carboxylase biotin carboxyl carrier protein [Deltaproteobacteria bacterium]